MKGLAQYLLLRISMGLVGLFPERVAIRLGELTGRIWSRFDKRRREMAARHMRRVLEDQAVADSFADEVLASYGRYWAEAMWVRPRRVEGLLANTTVDGLDLVTQARDQGRGMIYGLPHMGNWEAAAPVAGNVGVPVVAVAEVLPNQRITDWLTRMRAQFGIEIVPATGRSEVMRRLETALAANKAVALLSDRDLRGRGIEIEFFGERTTLPPGPATLATKTGAPLFPVACYFSEGSHHVVIRPAIPVPDAPSRSDRVRLMTEALAREMEKLILEAPQQWHLVVPNWPSDRA